MTYEQNYIEYIKDTLWSFDLTGLNNKTLSEECLIVEKYLKRVFSNVEVTPQAYNVYGNFSTSVFKRYILFSVPSINIVRLYKMMQDVLPPLLQPGRNYVLQSWLNVYRKGEKIDWHNHWSPEYDGYHGFYCVDVEEMPSSTLYKFPDVSQDITTIPSKNGRLVFGKSNNDQHTSTLWDCDSKPRITIAFDIVPIISARNFLTLEDCFKNNIEDRFKNFDSYNPHNTHPNLNHYIPFAVT